MPENNFKKLYKELRTDNIKQKQTIAIQDNQIGEMHNTIKRLEKMLKAYDNSNTPPSKKLPASKSKPRNGNGNNNCTKKKQGGQNGHKGKTSKPKPTELENHRSKNCPDCNSDNLEVTGSITRDITETKKTIQTTTTRHMLDMCRCLECGRHNITVDTRGVVPKEGSYGPGIVSDVASSYESRMPVKMISENSERDMGIHISTGATCNILRRVGTCLNRPAKHILASLMTSSWKCAPLEPSSKLYNQNIEIF